MKKMMFVTNAIGPKIVTTIVAIFAIFFFYLTALGKDNAPRKPLYDSKPFNISQARLPASYNGHNPIDVSNKVRKLLLGKNEFETTDQYEARIDKAKESLGLYGFLSLNDVDAGEYEKVSYDADTQEWTAKIAGVYIESVVSITIMSGEKGSYIGQNAFGAKTRVSKREATRCMVKFIEDIDGLSNIILKFPMAMDEAKRIKGSVKILYIGSPIKSTRDTSYWEPDINYPYSTKAEILFLDMRLKEIWLYNYKTGEILLKCTDPKSFEVKRDSF